MQRRACREDEANIEHIVIQCDCLHPRQPDGTTLPKAFDLVEMCNEHGESVHPWCQPPSQRQDSRRCVSGALSGVHNVVLGMRVILFSTFLLFSFFPVRAP